MTPTLPADIQRTIVAMAPKKRVYVITMMEYTRVWYEVDAYSKEEALSKVEERQELDRNVKEDHLEHIEETDSPEFEWDDSD